MKRIGGCATTSSEHSQVLHFSICAKKICPQDMDSRQISLNAFSHMGLQQLESVGRFDTLWTPDASLLVAICKKPGETRLSPFFKVNFRDPEFKTFVCKYVTKLGVCLIQAMCVVFCFCCVLVFCHDFQFIAWISWQINEYWRRKWEASSLAERMLYLQSCRNYWSVLVISTGDVFNIHCLRQPLFHKNYVKAPVEQF